MKTLLEEMTCLLGKRPQNGSDGVEKGSGPSSASNEMVVRTEDSDKLDDFRLSAKKVELLTFDGKDSVAWITRAETYFEVQHT